MWLAYASQPFIVVLMEDKTKLKEYISKRKTNRNCVVTEAKTIKLPWYKRPLTEDEFIIRKGKDKNFYVHHNEWSEKIYIGPYKTINDAGDIVKLYIKVSLKEPVTKKIDENVHSLSIDNIDAFFCC
jgi:hypothetical protein